MTTVKLTETDVTDVINAHAEAARIAVDSGFDAFEIHLGHGYFCSSFLSPLINRRDDEFGGSWRTGRTDRPSIERVHPHPLRGDRVAGPTSDLPNLVVGELRYL